MLWTFAIPFKVLQGDSKIIALKYTYLLINFFVVVIPLAFSFHPGIRFYKRWNSFFPGMMITAAIFVIWDIIFTRLGVWSFNSSYITGLMIFNLPVEEVLFFVCIPYACVFTYYCISIFYKGLNKLNVRNPVSIVIILILLFSGIYFHDRLYSSVTFITAAAFLCYIFYYAKKEWSGRFIVSYVLLLVPFLVSNGILTGFGLDQPIVRYNDQQTTNLRVATIPIEDFAYSLLLIGINVFTFEHFTKKFSKQQ